MVKQPGILFVDCWAPWCQACQDFKPVFEKQEAYSIGVVTMDPNNHNVVWIGTGENNHQRALGYGNGVWKTLDGGQTWNHQTSGTSFSLHDVYFLDEKTGFIIGGGFWFI